MSQISQIFNMAKAISSQQHLACTPFNESCQRCFSTNVPNVPGSILLLQSGSPFTSKTFNLTRSLYKLILYEPYLYSVSAKMESMFRHSRPYLLSQKHIST